MKIIILLFLLSIFNAPPPDQECISDWAVIREITNSQHCNEQNPFGDYSLYICSITASSPAYGDYLTAKFASSCQYNEQEPVPAQKPQLVFLPVVTTGCPEGAWWTDGYCTIIGVSVTP